MHSYDHSQCFLLHNLLIITGHGCKYLLWKETKGMCTLSSESEDSELSGSDSEVEEWMPE